MPNAPMSWKARASPWLWAAGTVLLVAASGLATWRVTRGTASSAGASTQPVDARPRLAAGHDYYFHVKLIELTEQRPGGKAWDSVGDSGPDIRFSLTWRRNVIWKSNEKSDTLIGSWDLMKVDLRQIILTGGPTDLEGLVNAPLVHYDAGETVDLKVWDEDTVGSDDAGSIKVKLDDLSPGENLLPLPPGGALRRVVIDLVDRRTPLPDLVNTISNR
jgi:hypothetical protein